MTNGTKYGCQLVIPWDNDEFSLHLDDFPYSRLARTKSNMYPLVRSPLRQQWNTTIDEEEEEEEEEQDENQPIEQPAEGKRKSIQARIRSLSVKRRAHSSFPYNNSTHGMNPGNVEQDTIMVKKTSVSKPRGHVQHISPLMSLTSDGSTTSLPVIRKTHSVMYVARPRSLASETGSVQSLDSAETWKVSQKSIQQGVIVPSRSTSPPASVATTRIESAPPSVTSSVQSYQSVSVPNNADKLMFFEEVPPSPKSTFSQQFQSGFDIKNSVYIYDADMLKKKKKKQSPFLRLKNWFLHKST